MHEWADATIWERASWAANLLEGAGGFLAILAIILSIITFQQQQEGQSYKQIDEMYLHIHSLALADPRLDNPDGAADDEGFRQKYNIYAFIIWNLLETIYDRGQMRRVRTAWQPILQAEGVKHKAWFNEPRNRRLFKPDFVAFMNRGGFGGESAELRSACPPIPAARAS